MGYFDEENKENENGESVSGMTQLAEDALSEEEDKAEEKAKKKEEKARQRELRKIEKLEKKRKKREEKGLFTGDIEDSIVKKENKISGNSEEEPAGSEKAEAKDVEAKNSEEESAGSRNAEEKSAEAVKTETEAEKAGAVVQAAESDEETKNAESEASEEALAEEESEDGKKSRRRKKKKDQKTKPEDVNIVRDLLSLILYIGIVVVVCFLIVTFVGQRTTVNGDSMNPTLESGDSLWINKLAYRFGDPERYDIIVFPYEQDVHYIKRVIGLPGETVQITNTGDILINGKILEEPTKFARIINPGRASNPITLGPDEYFVLGDNRNNSKDSRYDSVGNIKKEKMIGKAVFRLTPFKKFGSIY